MNDQPSPFGAPHSPQDAVGPGPQYPTVPTPLSTPHITSGPSDSLPQPQSVGPVPGQASVPLAAATPLTSSSGRPLFAPDAPQLQPVNEAPQQLHRKKKRRSIILGIAVAVVFLLGGSAAAYYGIILPNKPENILRSSLQKSLEQKYVTATLDAEGKTGSDPSYKINAILKNDVAAKASAIEMKITVSGFVFPVEGRLINNSVYVKIGDISNLLKIVGSLDPSLDTLSQEFSKKISNQWISVDSTLVKDAGIDKCQDELSLTQQDYKMLDELYAKHKFISVGKVSSDTVNNSPAAKYELTIDDNTGADFVSELQNLPAVKKANGCVQSDSKQQVTGDQDISNQVKKNLKDNDKTPLTVWIDKKSKLITKLATQSTEQDKKNGITGSAQVVFDYKKVTIDKPTNAKSANDFIADLMQLYQSNLSGSVFERDLNSFPAPN